MCVIVFKPSGVNIPSNNILHKCWKANQDGAGIMWADEGQLHYRKGFMKFHDLMEVLAMLKMKYGPDVTSIPLAIHFRIGTSASKTAPFTHPYPVCDSYDQMKELSGEPDMAVMHNGIFRFSTATGLSDYNDSMEFVKDVVNNCVGENGFIQKSKKPLLRLVGTGSRLLYLHKSGKYYASGNWVRSQGVLYSNSYWVYQ